MKLFSCPEDNDKIAKIMECIEYTALLAPDATDAQIKKACDEAIFYKMGHFVPFQAYFPKCFEYLKGSDVKMVQGSSDSHTRESRYCSIREGLEAGCCEVDILAKLDLFLDGRYDAFQDDVHEIVELADGYHADCKLIIETGFLTDAQKILISRLGLEAGVVFIKTCLGMRKGRGTLHDILLIKDAFGDDVKIKATGGIASLEDAYEMLQAGADRVALRGLAGEQLRRLQYAP